MTRLSLEFRSIPNHFVSAVVKTLCGPYLRRVFGSCGNLAIADTPVLGQELNTRQNYKEIYGNKGLPL